MVRLSWGSQTVSISVDRKGFATSGHCLSFPIPAFPTEGADNNNNNIRFELIGQSGLVATGMVALATLLVTVHHAPDSSAALPNGIETRVTLYSPPDGKGSRQRAGAVTLLVRMVDSMDGPAKQASVVPAAPQDASGLGASPQASPNPQHLPHQIATPQIPGLPEPSNQPLLSSGSSAVRLNADCALDRMLEAALKVWIWSIASGLGSC